MTKMNWEHRNKMQKVYDNPSSSSRKPRTKRKGTRRPQTNKPVNLKTKFKGKCKGCGKEIPVGMKVVWLPVDKGILHRQCLKGYLNDNTAT